jgi:hypothetical protein
MDWELAINIGYGHLSFDRYETEGHDRIFIEVTAKGDPLIRFLDQTGKGMSQSPQLAKN